MRSREAPIVWYPMRIGLGEGGRRRGGGMGVRSKMMRNE
jgi:hypothetical protein